jgi:hypothetical protein
MWSLLLLLLHPKPFVSLLLLIALLLHLILDDIGYWAYKLKIQKFKVYPQINWLYPIRHYSNHELVKENKEVLKIYLIKAWPISMLEGLLIFIALVVYLK